MANALSWATPGPGAGAGSQRRLTDVHVGLPASGVAGGTQHLVSGSYEYFHYLQVRARAGMRALRRPLALVPRSLASCYALGVPSL